MRRSSGLNVSNLSITVINNVDQVELLLEQFFTFHTNFLWDKAKDYIDKERDAFRATHASHVSSILVSLMNALSQLTLADKNYLTLQFFSSKVFQRKDSVKCSYESLRQEFVRLEERGSSIGQLKSSSQPNTPHHQNHQQQQHCSPCNYGSLQPSNEQAMDVLNVEELFGGEEAAAVRAKSASPTAHITEYETPVTPTPPKNQSFISRIFSFSKSRHSSSPSTNYGNDSMQSLNSNGDESSPSDSMLLRHELNCSLESLDRFAAHLSGQLVYYAKVRVEMIDLYDRLSSVCLDRKFCLLDDCLRTLQSIHTNADRNFHHPVLSRLKSMFMFECDILLSLLRVHENIQNWRFLDSLFFLQDAHNKLNMMANLRDQMISQMNTYTPNPLKQSANAISPLVPAASSSAQLRRNFTSSSLSSSGSSNLSVPGPISGGGGGGGGGTGGAANTSTTSTTSSHSPNPMSPLNFIYPSQYTATMYVPPKLFASKFNNTMPMLLKWLNHFKQFLLSKYSFYFHSLLMVHLTPSTIASSTFSASIGASSNHSSSANYAQIESQMRQLCQKHLYDFHSKIVQFVKKYDSSYMILIFDAQNKEFSMSGYRSPYLKKELPNGISSFPVIYSYPDHVPKNRIPSLIMIMGERKKQLNSLDIAVVEYDKPHGDGHVGPNSSSQNGNNDLNSSTLAANTGSTSQPANATYFLIRPDPDFTLAMICEQKKLERDTAIPTFLKELTLLLKGTNIFASLRNGGLK